MRSPPVRPVVPRPLCHPGRVSTRSLEGRAFRCDIGSKGGQPNVQRGNFTRGERLGGQIGHVPQWPSSGCPAASAHDRSGTLDVEIRRAFASRNA